VLSLEPDDSTDELLIGNLEVTPSRVAPSVDDNPTLDDGIVGELNLMRRELGDSDAEKNTMTKRVRDNIVDPR
jgi:hypothetical protein